MRCGTFVFSWPIVGQLKLPFELKHLRFFTILSSFPIFCSQRNTTTKVCRLGVALGFIHHGSESWWHVAEIDSWISWEADCCYTCLVYWSLIYFFKYIKQECGRNIWKGSCYRTCIDHGGVARRVVWWPHNIISSLLKLPRVHVW